MHSLVELKIIKKCTVPTIKITFVIPKKKISIIPLFGVVNLPHWNIYAYNLTQCNATVVMEWSGT